MSVNQITFSAFVKKLLSGGVCALLLFVGSAHGKTPIKKALGELESDAAVMDAKEAYLRAIDFTNPNAYRYEVLGSGSANTFAWKIKDPRLDNETVAMIKCDWGVNYHEAPIAVYGLGRYLGYNVFPVSVERFIPLTQLKDVDGNQLADTDQSCAVKEWVGNFAQIYWRVSSKEGRSADTFITKNREKRKLVRMLSCRYDQDNVDYVWQGCSRFADPNPMQQERAGGRKCTRFKGDTSLHKAASDFSNLMIIDALIGNRDRFPGGNIHVRSLSDESIVDEVEGVTYPNIEIFSIDVGSSFVRNASTPTRKWHNYSLRTLKKYVSRFDRNLIDKLRDLRHRILSEDRAALLEELPFLDFKLSRQESMHALDSLTYNIQYVLEHVEQVKTQTCRKKAIYFQDLEHEAAQAPSFR